MIYKLERVSCLRGASVRFSKILIFVLMGITLAVDRSSGSVQTVSGDGPTPERFASVTGEQELNRTMSTPNTWSSEFGTGPNAGVYSLLTVGVEIYVGGDFTTVGDLSASRIAKYNTITKTWSSLSGRGVDDRVTTMALVGENLYIGGSFLNIVGGTTTSALRVARYNIATGMWSALGVAGSGMDGTVWNMLADASNLYISGEFTAVTSGGASSTMGAITKFDTAGDTFSKLGSGSGNGANGKILAMVKYGSTLYVGGDSTTLNLGGAVGTEVTVTGMGCYDLGSATWNVMPGGGTSGTNGTVNSMVMIGDTLYFGGVFTLINGSINNYRLGRLNLTTGTWSKLPSGGGSGVYGGVSGPVSSLVAMGTNLVIAGQFSTSNFRGAPQVMTRGVSKYDTLTGSYEALTDPLGDQGVTLSIDGRALARMGEDLYIGGLFTETGDSKASLRIGRYTFNLPPEVSSIVRGEDSVGSVDFTVTFSESVTGVTASNFTVVTTGAVSGASVTSVTGGGRVWTVRVATGSGAGTLGLNMTNGTGITDSGGGSLTGLPFTGELFTLTGLATSTSYNTWSGSFASGPNGTVLSILVVGDEVYVGGSFTAVGSLAASRIARFNTTTGEWSALGEVGDGVDGDVYAMAMVDGDLYVGGSFQNIIRQNITGSTTISGRRFARFNVASETWSAVGSAGDGFDGTVYEIFVAGKDLYVGGAFTSVTSGGVSSTMNAITRYDTGSDTFTKLGTGAGNGANRTIRAIARDESTLYVGGSETILNQGGTQITVSSIGKYDLTTGAWSGLPGGSGSGPSGDINSMVVVGDTLYIGGAFTVVNGTIGARCLAGYDLTTNTWSTLNGPGGGNGFDGDVYELVAIGSRLIISGNFTTSNVGGTTVATRGVSRYNISANTYEALVDTLGGQGVGAGSYGDGLAVFGESIFVGGNFTTVGDTRSSSRIGLYTANFPPAASSITTSGQNPTNLSSVEFTVSFSESVTGVTASNFTLMTTGTVSGASVTSVTGGGRVWTVRVGAGSGAGTLGLNMTNGTGITDGLGGSLTGLPFTGEVFTLTGQTTATIYNAWSDEFATGPNDTVLSILAVGDDIYVGGNFTAIGSLSASRIARFNTISGTWSALGAPGSGVDDSVYAMALVDGDLYVGGSFLNIIGATTISGRRFARFNVATNTWSPVGSAGDGFDDTVYELFADETDLYIGGAFNTVTSGGVSSTMNAISRFDTTNDTYNKLGTGAGNGGNRTIRAIERDDTTLYVGGSETILNQGGAQVSVSSIGTYDLTTETWSALPGGSGSGPEGEITSMAVIGDSLYIGGEFTIVDGTVQGRRLARFHIPTGVWSTVDGDGGGNGLDLEPANMIAMGENLIISGFFSGSNIGGRRLITHGVVSYDTVNKSYRVLADPVSGEGIRSSGSGEFGFGLASIGESIYIGGNFSIVGDGRQSRNIGKYTINLAPTIESIARASINPVTAASVDYTLTFSESISGLTTANLAIVTTGAVNGAAITSISGGGRTWTARVSTGSGSGTLGLNLNSVTGIRDSLNGGMAATTFTGEIYTLTGTLVNPYPYAETIRSVYSSLGAGGRAILTWQLTNNSGSTGTLSYVTTLPAGLIGVPDSCVASIGTCLIDPVQTLGGQKIRWSGTIPNGQTVTLTYRVEVAVGVVTGTSLCTSSTVKIGSIVISSWSSCTIVNAPLSGPGLPMLSAVTAGQMAGSVLIFNVYTSQFNTVSEDTRFSLTNTNPTIPVNVHLFFVDGTSGAIADRFVQLARNQTVSFLASEQDPGITGYLIAVATDENGCPATFNHLIGEAFVKFGSGHMANLAAIAVQALSGGLPSCSGSSATATLNFDGTTYGRLPRALAVDSLPARAEGNETLLILNRIGGDLTVGASRLGSIFGLLYDDVESSASFTLSGGTSQMRGILGNNFPRTAPRYDTMIPAGRSGWIKFWETEERAMTGAVINLGVRRFDHGHNLHQLSTTAGVTLTIPIYPPGR